MKLFRCSHCGVVVAFEVEPDRGCPCGVYGSLYRMWERITYVEARAFHPSPEDPNAP